LDKWVNDLLNITIIFEIGIKMVIKKTFNHESKIS